MDTATANGKVQHVTKKSSDELLRKFAELGSGAGHEARKKRQKKSRGTREVGQSSQCESPSRGGAVLVERRSLLLPAAATRRSALLRRLGIGRAQQRARDVRNKSLFGTIEKTWRRTVEGPLGFSWRSTIIATSV